MAADALRLLSALPTATKLAALVSRAAKGDTGAMLELKESGWAEALDILIAPGTGEKARTILSNGVEVYRNIQTIRGEDYIDAEYRVLNNNPSWHQFLEWLKRRRWGTFVVLGPKGRGKTMLALRLAQVWQERTGWTAEGVNIYPEGRYDWVELVPPTRFQNRIKKIISLLNPPEEKPGEMPTVVDPDELEEQLEKYRRRIVLIDEMSLVATSHGQDPGRQMVRQIMAQARHLQWLIVYIGQLAKMLPNDLLNCEAIFIKQPTGREAIVDRDDALTQDLWTRATEAFATMRSSEYYREPYDDPRAWAFVDCPDLGNGRGWSGLMPSGMPVDSEVSDG
ncbi:MAG: hypothetical protein ACYC4L_11385 [Chloroflexota bacterium]